MCLIYIAVFHPLCVLTLYLHTEYTCIYKYLILCSLQCTCAVCDMWGWTYYCCVPGRGELYVHVQCIYFGIHISVSWHSKVDTMRGIRQVGWNKHHLCVIFPILSCMVTQLCAQSQTFSILQSSGWLSITDKLHSAIAVTNALFFPWHMLIQ